VAKISPQTPPRRAASLRLTEEGKRLLAAEEYSRALAPLERSIAVDSSNPYSYFYLAKAHYHLGRYQESLNFLDVAESRLSSEPFWMAETFALRGDNYRRLGFMHRAETSYEQALKLNPGSKTAADGRSRLRSAGQAPAR
jgi:tetratricopeptide (TPR) repeat protein